MILNEFNIQVQAKNEDWLRSAAFQTLFIDWKIEPILPVWKIISKTKRSWKELIKIDRPVIDRRSTTVQWWTVQWCTVKSKNFTSSWLRFCLIFWRNFSENPERIIIYCSKLMLSKNRISKLSFNNFGERLSWKAALWWSLLFPYDL